MPTMRLRPERYDTSALSRVWLRVRSFRSAPATRTRARVLAAGGVVLLVVGRALRGWLRGFCGELRLNLLRASNCSLRGRSLSSGFAKVYTSGRSNRPFSRRLRVEIGLGCFVSALLLGVGVYLIVTWCFQRTGDEPRCGNCGYILIGKSPAKRCPECGSLLVEAGVVRGQRWLGRGRLWAGLEFLFLGCLLLSLEII